MIALRHASIALLLLAAAGCDGLGGLTGGGDAEYAFAVDATPVTIAEGVEATFTNRSDQTLHLYYQGCLLAGLERRSARTGRWEAVPIPILCTMEAKPIIPVAPGASHRAMLRPWVLEETDPAPGVYRLTLTFGKTEDGASETASSEPFTVSGS